VSEADDILAALAPVVAAFDGLGVRHYIGDRVAHLLDRLLRSTGG